MLTDKDPIKDSEIRSRLVTFENANGLRIVGYLDEGPESGWNERIIILAPRYGETKKNSLQLAYTLAANGFKVLRFDQSNHVGESDGNMIQFTLAGATEDILAAVSYIDRFFEPAEIILVALSLSARCGFRACARESRISRFVSMVGMVNMDHTLKEIYQRDFFGELAEGADWRNVDILGFEIDGRNFYDSLVESNMLCLNGTLEDASLIQQPVLYIGAGRDLWVCEEEVGQVLERCNNSNRFLLEHVGHEVNENQQMLQLATAKLLEFCLLGLESRQCVVPDKRAILEQNRVERKRLQELMKFTNSEREFWGDYLGKFGIIEGAGYYIEYFTKLSELLGSVASGDVIVDAGCGNGFYGTTLLRSSLATQPHAEIPGPVHYCGIDLTPEGLTRSYTRLLEDWKQLHAQCPDRTGGVSFSYRKIDFDTIDLQAGCLLPFSENSVDKLCCSLVVSYLKEPVRLLQEIYRMLRPGGVAVVSSMKPGCDMTVLYHEFLKQGSPEDSVDDEARSLLNAAGKIKLKKDSEVYQFFTEEALSEMAVAAGFRDVSGCRSLGDQANVIRVVK